jgi:hypothetical protein
MFEKRQKLIALARAYDRRVEAKPVGAKKPIGIEELLRWAYREELPKEQDCGGVGALGFGHAWGSLTEYGELLTVVDDPGSCNRWGVVPDRGARVEPHPDARMVAEAVLDLDQLELSLPEEWEPLGDLGDLGVLGWACVARALDRLTVIGADGARALRTTPRRLVFKHAILGGCPVWEADVPEVKLVCGANGRPKYFVRNVISMADGIPLEIEADGWSKKARRPVCGAYTKPYLEPDPTDAAVARGEYEIWRAALDILAEDLAGRLEAFDVMPSASPSRPWEVQIEPVCESRILPDLTKVCAVAPSGRKKNRRKAAVFA